MKYHTLLSLFCLLAFGACNKEDAKIQPTRDFRDNYIGRFHVTKISIHKQSVNGRQLSDTVTESYDIEVNYSISDSAVYHSKSGRKRPTVTFYTDSLDKEIVHIESSGAIFTYNNLGGNNEGGFVSNDSISHYRIYPAGNTGSYQHFTYASRLK